METAQAYVSIAIGVIAIVNFGYAGISKLLKRSEEAWRYAFVAGAVLAPIALSFGIWTVWFAPRPAEVSTVEHEVLGPNAVAVVGDLETIGRPQSEVDVYFEWGEEKDAYGNKTDVRTLDEEGEFQFMLSELVPYTKYYFRANAAYGDTVKRGPTLAFETPGLTVDTDIPPNVPQEYTIEGTVDGTGCGYWHMYAVLEWERMWWPQEGEILLCHSPEEDCYEFGVCCLVGGSEDPGKRFALKLLLVDPDVDECFRKWFHECERKGDWPPIEPGEQPKEGFEVLKVADVIRE